MQASSLAARSPRSTWTAPQRAKNDVIYAVIAVLIAIFRRLPRGVVAAVCRAIGALAYVVLPNERRRARDRLASGIGRRPEERRVRGAFIQIGALLADAIALLRPNERASETLELDDRSRDVFRDALAEGRGVVFISAHLGPWERMAALLVEEGFPISTIARESYDPRITALYERIRAPRGVRSIYRGAPGAVFAVARDLGRGRAVGFLIDLPGRGLPFLTARLFGEDAELPIGAARIALARRSAVVVGTCVPDSSARNGALSRASIRVLIDRIPAEELATGPVGEAELHARIARALDARIALWPGAWLGLFAPPRLQRPDDPR